MQVVPEGHSATHVDPHLTASSLDDLDFNAIAASLDLTYDHTGLAGVQDKVSLAMISVPVTASGSAYILKLNPPEYPHLVENEAFFLKASARSLIPTVSGHLLTDKDNQPGLALERFDRVGHGDALRALAVEDSCQVRGLYPAAKYLGSLDDTLGALVRACAAPKPAALEFLRQAVFTYVSANGDAHAKNFSILADESGRFHPAPAYNLPTSQPYGDNTLALSIDGRRDGNLTAARFIALGAALDLPEKAARRAITETATAVDAWIDDLASLPFDQGVVHQLRRVIANRQRLLFES